MAVGFVNVGHEIRIADYNQLGYLADFIKLGDKLSFELRQRKLVKLVKQYHPDMIIFIISRPKFDFARLKSHYRGIVAVYDFDGPNWPCLKQKDWLKEIDLLLTVSRPIERALREQNYRVHYLPHGVDVNYYSPDQNTDAELVRFAAPVSYYPAAAGALPSAG